MISYQLFLLLVRLLMQHPDSLNLPPDELPILLSLEDLLLLFTFSTK